MPEPFVVLLDQNLPKAIIGWLSVLRPLWKIYHATEVGLNGKSDVEVFNWAQDRQAAIMTFDEDFADQRSFPVGTHYGVIRFRVWPTTTEEIKNALERLLKEASDSELVGSLVIIDRSRIRIRSRRTRKS